MSTAESEFWLAVGGKFVLRLRVNFGIRTQLAVLPPRKALSQQTIEYTSTRNEVRPEAIGPIAWTLKIRMS